MNPSAARRPPKKFHPHPFAYHEEIVLTIDALTNLGAGLGRVDGWVVFVAYALPGEKVKARVFRNDKRHSEADLIEVLDPSPDRVDPVCPLFGECGGCQYQHLAYESQIHWKARQVGELLRHLAGLEAPVSPVIPSPRPYGYRSKITPHFQKPDSEGRIEAIGFLKVGRRRDVVEVDHCPIALPVLNERLGPLKRQVRARAATDKKGATLLLRASDGEPPVLSDHQAICEQRVGSIRFRFPAGEFFQNNPLILEAFTAHVRKDASAGSARHLVDAYCGSGLFALTAAPAFERVLGIEISESSIRWARENAEVNGLTQAEFLEGRSEAIFARCDFPGAETAMIVDPPRRGCDAEFLRQLFEFGPERVVYVSCNPATQMRDLNAFAEHGYALSRIQPFDLFPQTKHLECVATLIRG